MMTSMKQPDSKTITATALYLAAALLYFSPVDIPHKIAVGLLILSVFSFRGGNPAFIAAALFFSFLGDLSGSYKAGSSSMMPFFGQMGAFAVGHVFFVLHFLKMRSVRNKWAVMSAAVFALAVLASAFIIIVPHIQAVPIAAGVGLYAVIISMMLLAAMLTGSVVLSLGAMLFVLSDYLLAVNMFVTDVPYEKYLIMAPYYAAQLMFFLTTRNNYQHYTK